MQTLPRSPLLGGLTPRAFMQRHWHKTPLLIRAAVPGVIPPLTRDELFALAARDDVESRLVRHDGEAGGRWTLQHGPFARRALPGPRTPRWTLLVQGLDLHVDAAHELLARFRFVPDARLDDLMVSYATDGGGVGPHVDSYDVFLLQVHGRRRWRIGPLKGARAAALRTDVPLKMLARFTPTHDWVLDAGDMLYLPPGWAHDGVALGECMTCSIGFRAPAREQLAGEVLQRLADAGADDAGPLYRDPDQRASTSPARVPEALHAFAADAVARLAGDARALARALGETLTEPKANVWFDAGTGAAARAGVRLDRRTRMMYDRWFVFINGEAYRAAGGDARLMRRLADARELAAADIARLGPQARALLAQWSSAGWLHAADRRIIAPPSSRSRKTREPAR